MWILNLCSVFAWLRLGLAPFKRPNYAFCLSSNVGEAKAQVPWTNHKIITENNISHSVSCCFTLSFRYSLFSAEMCCSRLVDRLACVCYTIAQRWRTIKWPTVQCPRLFSVPWKEKSFSWNSRQLKLKMLRQIIQMARKVWLAKLNWTDHGQRCELESNACMVD